MAYALYYPTIEFQNVEFLKKSILIWDRVFRIVPLTYEPNDDIDVKEAISANAVTNLYLENNEKDAAEKRFLKFYKKLKSPKNQLAWPSGFSKNDFISLHPEKTDDKLRAIFQKISSTLNDGFMRIPKDIGGIYMLYLSEIIAQKRNLHLLTDSDDSWIAGTYIAQKGNFNEQVYNENSKSYLCNLTIDGLLPDTLANIPMENVLRFAEDHQEERLKFQKELENLKEEISKCENKGHAEYIVNDFIKRFEKAKADYRKEIGFFNKRDVYSLFSTGLSTTMSFLSLSGNPYDPINLGAGLLVGAVSAFATRELIPRGKGVASYLVSAEKLTHNNIYLHRKFNEFIND